MGVQNNLFVLDNMLELQMSNRLVVIANVYAGTGTRLLGLCI